MDLQTITSQGNQTHEKPGGLLFIWLLVGSLLIGCGLICFLVVAVLAVKPTVITDLPLIKSILTPSDKSVTRTTQPESSLDENAGLQVGDPAPDFSLYTLDGRLVSLSDFRGRAVLINFWATWCGPCLDEIPLLNTRYQQYSPDLVVLAIEQGDSETDIRQVIVDNQLTLPILLDPDYSVGDLYRIEYYPTSFFIDTDGVIHAIVDSSMTDADLDEYLPMIGINKK